MSMFDVGDQSATSGDNSLSSVARLGAWGQKYTDPLAWIFGKKYTNLLVKLADKSNKVFAKVGKPLAKIDKAINPVRRFIPAVDKIATWTENKPLDTAAIAAGAYFGGSALMGNGAGGGGSTAANSGELTEIVPTGSHIGSGAGELSEIVPTGSHIGGTGASSTPASTGYDWQSQMKNMPQQGSQAPSQQHPFTGGRSAQLELARQQEEERLRMARAAALRGELPDGMYSPAATRAA